MSLIHRNAASQNKAPAAVDNPSWVPPQWVRHAHSGTDHNGHEQKQNSNTAPTVLSYVQPKDLVVSVVSFAIECKLSRICAGGRIYSGDRKRIKERNVCNQRTGMTSTHTARQQIGSQHMTRHTGFLAYRSA